MNSSLSSEMRPNLSHRPSKGAVFTILTILELRISASPGSPVKARSSTTMKRMPKSWKTTWKEKRSATLSGTDTGRAGATPRRCLRGSSIPLSGCPTVLFCVSPSPRPRSGTFFCDFFFQFQAFFLPPLPFPLFLHPAFLTGSSSPSTHWIWTTR